MSTKPPPPVWPPVKLLLRSARAVVVDKPAGLLVHNSQWAGPRETTLTELVRRDVDAGLVPVHRLDRGTSGACVFAVDGAAARDLQAELTTSTKSYLAIVRGHVKAAIAVTHALDDDDVKGSERKEARSLIEPVAMSTVARVSLVRVTMWTGRRHQARRHCKHVSHPIIGDATHGKGPLNREFAARYGLNRLCLHARVVVVEGVPVTAPLPADWASATATLWPDVNLEAAIAALELPMSTTTKTPMDQPTKPPRIFAMSFASVYPLYVKKAEKKGRTQQEVDEVIRWLTGYSDVQLQRALKDTVTFDAFFADAPALNANVDLIKGVVCGVRVEEVDDLLMQKIRWLDLLVDELARGKGMNAILRGG